MTDEPEAVADGPGIDDAIGKLLDGNPMGVVRERAESADHAAVAMLHSLRKVLGDFMAEFSKDELSKQHQWNIIAVSVAIDNSIKALEEGDVDDLFRTISQIASGGNKVRIPGLGNVEAQVLTGPDLGKFLGLVHDGMSPEEAFNRVTGEDLEKTLPGEQRPATEE